jgi:hypothetical protein
MLAATVGAVLPTRGWSANMQRFLFNKKSLAACWWSNNFIA